MVWKKLRAFSAAASAISGVVLGVSIVIVVALATGERVAGAGLSGISLTCVGLALGAAGVSRSSLNRLDALRQQRAPFLVTAPGTADPVAARVRKVYPQRRQGVVTAQLLHGSPEPARLALVEALTTPPLELYTQLPERYGIPAGAPVALLVDRSEQEIALLDDRVSQEQLAGIRADPRWNGATFGSMFERQGLWLCVAWGGGALAVTVGIGLLLVLL